MVWTTFIFRGLMSLFSVGDIPKIHSAKAALIYPSSFALVADFGWTRLLDLMLLRQSHSKLYIQILQDIQFVITIQPIDLDDSHSPINSIVSQRSN
jgi:hypothetical protein